MKRAGILIVALVMVAATGASAKIGLGVRAGMGAAYANYQVNYAALGETEAKNTGAALAAHVGLALNVGLPLGFEVEGGAQFALLGSHTKSSNLIGEYTWNRSLYTIQIPVRAGWSYSFGKLIGVYAQIGPQFTVAVGGKDKNTGNVKIASVTQDGAMTFGDNGSKRFLMDLSMHAGVMLGGFRVGGYYDLGLLNMSSTSTLKYRPSSAGVSLAYFFGF